jgi:ElaB/YqjD/DUF883 family membrane-anchored ribosome-binding protein
MLDSLHAPRPWWVAPAIGVAVAACSASLLQTVWVPAQVATARIALDPVAAGAAGAAREWIATQIALIRSERVARRVLAEVGPEALPDHLAFDAHAGATRLLAHLGVEATEPEGLVSVGYRSSDAALSARIANAFVAAYDRVSQELRANVAAAAAERARQRVSVLRDEMDQAHARLQALQDTTNLRADAPALVEAARVAGLAAETNWFGLRDDRTGGDQRSVLGNQGAAGSMPPVGVAPGEVSAAPLQSARDEYEMARQALAAATVRFGELSSQEVVSRPTMTVVDAAEAGSGEQPWQGGPAIVWLAAAAGVVAGFLLRPLAQWIDPRVRNAEHLASRLGVPVFGALINGERAARGAAAKRGESRTASAPPLAIPALQ